MPDGPVLPSAASSSRGGRKIPAVVWMVGAAGVLFMLLVLAGIGAAIAIPAMLQANRETRQAAVQELLRSLASSERVYAAQSGGDYGTLGQLAARGFIDSSLAVEPVRANGYRIRAEWVERRTFCFSATPESKGDTPYFIDQTMTVYEGYPSGREKREP
jgi:type II secretory pathway pseudopilin PulG